MEDIEPCHQQLQDLETHLSNPESKAVKVRTNVDIKKLLTNIDLVGLNVLDCRRAKVLDHGDERFVSGYREQINNSWKTS